jgi:hypothetical protein
MGLIEEMAYHSRFKGLEFGFVVLGVVVQDIVASLPYSFEESLNSLQDCTETAASSHWMDL